MAEAVYPDGVKTLTLTEAAVELDMASSTLRHQIHNGRLKATRVGPLWVVTAREVARYRLQSRGKSGRPVKMRDSHRS